LNASDTVFPTDSSFDEIGFTIKPDFAVSFKVSELFGVKLLVGSIF